MEVEENENIELQETKLALPPMTTLTDIEEKTGDVDRLIPDKKLLGIYQDALTNIQSDRAEISEVLQRFLDMVLNEGDATAASKEAVVGLVKAKSETNDQVIKIADLMTRLKMK